METFQRGSIKDNRWSWRTVTTEQATVKAGQIRRSLNSPLRLLLASAASAVITTVLMGLLWKEKPFFAGAAVVLYLMGGMRGFPWKTPIRKSVSIGIFVGIVASSAIFY